MDSGSSNKSRFVASGRMGVTRNARYVYSSLQCNPRRNVINSLNEATRPTRIVY